MDPITIALILGGGWFLFGRKKKRAGVHPNAPKQKAALLTVSKIDQPPGYGFLEDAYLPEPGDPSIAAVPRGPVVVSLPFDWTGTARVQGSMQIDTQGKTPVLGGITGRDFLFTPSKLPGAGVATIDLRDPAGKGFGQVRVTYTS